MGQRLSIIDFSHQQGIICMEAKVVQFLDVHYHRASGDYRLYKYKYILYT